MEASALSDLGRCVRPRRAVRRRAVGARERRQGRWSRSCSRFLSCAKRFGAELLGPEGFGLGDRFANHLDRCLAARGERDAFRAEVFGVGSAFEVVDALEFAEEVVQCLLGDPQAGGELGRSFPSWPWVLEDEQRTRSGRDRLQEVPNDVHRRLAPEHVQRLRHQTYARGAAGRPERIAAYERSHGGALPLTDRRTSIYLRMSI
jgi:hypothetical protein